MRRTNTTGLVAVIASAFILPALLSGCSGKDSSGSTSAAASGGAGNGGTTGASSAVGGSNSGGKSAASKATDTKAATGGTKATSGAMGQGGSSETEAQGGSSEIGGQGEGGGTASNAQGGKTATNTKAAGGATGKGGSATGKSGSGGATEVLSSKAGSPSTGGSSTQAGGATGAGGGGECPALSDAPTEKTDGVAGKLITFNTNGGWCWYQDERVIVDAKANKLVIGSVIGTGTSKGYIQATIYDIAAGSGKTATLSTGLTSDFDDHNAPAFVLRPDGKYVGLWSGHRSDCYTRFSTFDGSAWAAEKKFDWAGSGCPWPGADTNKVTYSNPWYMGTSIYAGVRSVGTNPNFLVSNDDGGSWSYYGRLSATKQSGYVAGYYKYWGNNTDRIDFVGTEAHPRDFDTSLYHGYIKDGKVYDSKGTVVDGALKDASATATDAKDINEFTPVFKTQSSVGGVKLEHAWNHDIVRYDDGTVAILGQARVSGTGTDDPDKRAIYSRFDGTSWKTTHLGKLGTKLYSSEQDYTGLSALDPDNPHIIYLSTLWDPRDAAGKTQTTKREIYMGVTCDNGATWKWSPITQGSTMDNIRPVVPKWDGSHKALLWLRGTYTSAQNYDMKVVGLITGS